jgi:hypothetical protein
VNPSAAPSARTWKGVATGKREREVGANATAESIEGEAETSDKTVKREQN